MSAPSGERVVGYVPGAFDMFHIGHLNIIQRARQHCDHLIVGVVTDDALEAMKGIRPVIPLEERLEIVAALDVVNEVAIDFSANKLEVWERLRFDVLFKGDDWKGTAKGDRLERDMASVGVQIHYFPYTVHTSSTKLRMMLAERA